MRKENHDLTIIYDKILEILKDTFVLCTLDMGLQNTYISETLVTHITCNVQYSACTKLFFYLQNEIHRCY